MVDASKDKNAAVAQGVTKPLDAAEKEIVAEAVEAAPTDAKKAAVASAISSSFDEAKKEIAAEALDALPVHQQEEIASQLFVTPSQPVTDRLALRTGLAGMICLGAALVVLIAAVIMLVITANDAPATAALDIGTGDPLETFSLLLPLTLIPMILVVTAAIFSGIGYLLLRAAGAASKEVIPKQDFGLLSQVLLQSQPKEAINEYIRLRSLTGLSGFFTKMGLSGLPLATIALTLIFTVLAIWVEAFFDLAKLTLGVFLGSYVQQHTGTTRQG